MLGMGIGVFLSSQTFALEQPCHRLLKLAIDPQGKLFTVNARKEIGGILVSFFQGIEKETNCKVEWIQVPRARGLLGFKDGIYDVIYAVKTEERDQQGTFIPLTSFYTSLIVLKGLVKSNDVEKILQQENLFFNVVRGYDYGPEYRKLVLKLKEIRRLEEVPDLDTIGRKMRINRTNATIVNAALFVEVVESTQLEEKIDVFTLKHLSNSKGGIYLSNKTFSKSEIQALTKVIEKFGSGNRVKKLYTEHYPEWALKGFEFHIDK
jgi:polar amino acid transport system substrate-binding protein